MRTTPLKLALVAAALLGALGAACDRKPETGAGKAPSERTREPTGAAASAPVDVRLAAVELRPLARTVTVTGTIFGEEEAIISAKVPGRLSSLRADLGDEIEPGGILAEIDATDYRLALDQRKAAMTASLAKVGLDTLPAEDFDAAGLPTVQRARAEEANARARLDRAATLHEQTPPLISAQDFADIQTQHEVARRDAEVQLLEAQALIADARAQSAAVATAEQAIADTRVAAPSPPGMQSLRYRVASRDVSVGEYVTVGRPLFRVVASDRIKFRGSAPERFSGSVRVGQPAKIMADAPGTTLEGEVTRVSPRVDPASRSFEVEIEAPNPKRALKPGSFARASIVTETDESALLVPAGAVQVFAGVEKVYTVTDGKAVEHRVRTGDRVGGLVEIVDAPALASERVVVSSGSSLAPGVAVRVVETARAER